MLPAALLTLVVAAPLPQPPKLSAELLVGRWEFSWGGMPAGWIEFRADGRYVSRHSPGAEPLYTGFYSVRGDVLTLYEDRMPCPCDWRAADCRTEYPIPVSMERYPVIVGRGGYATFSNPQR